MIVFDQETRSFSVGNSVGVAGSLGYGGYQEHKKKKFIDEQIANGVDIKIAKQNAKKRFGGMAGNAAKGYLVGRGASVVGKRIANLGKSGIDSIKSMKDTKKAKKKAAKLVALKSENQ